MENKDFDKFIEDQKKLNELIDRNTASMGSFVSAQANALKLSRQLKHSEEQLNKQQKKFEESKNKLALIKHKLADENLKLSKQEIANLKEQEAILEDENKLHEKQIAYHKSNLNSYKQQLTLINKSLSGWRSVGNVVKNEVGSALKSGWKSMLAQDKAVRNTQLSMGILTNQAKSFSMNIYRSSARTQMLGANAKDLAGYQKDYSEQIGRATVLTDQGLEAMTEMAKGTTLGAEGAVRMTSEMDNFGLSVMATRDLVEKTVNSAHKMGVNSASVTKTMMNNMRIAQKYNFKEGVAGLGKMAIQAEKFKTTIEGVAGFADKLFTPEGAIDAAAQLQVLGGEWAKIADPFSLMYKARNDMAGLQQSMIEATKGVAKFNEATGAFDITGMNMHRLREISKVTGQSVDELAESARAFARTEDIKMQISASVDKNYEDFITSTAQYNKDKGGYFIEIGGKEKNIKDLNALNNSELKNIVLQQENLKKRAIEAQSVDELWTNLKDSFKATLLPLLKGIELGLHKPLAKVIDWLDKNDITTKIANLTGTIGEFIVDNPVKSIIGAVAAIGLFELAKWGANGFAFGMGFNRATSMFGGDSGGLMGSLGSKTGGFLGKSAGKFGMSTKAMVGTGVGLGVAGAGLSMGRELRDDPNDITGKVMGAGGMALQGAALGMLAGPIGAAVGGALGLALGTYMETSRNDTPKGQEASKMQDFVMRPGSKAQPFSSNDTLIGFKPDGPIAKNADSSVGSSPKSLKIEFAPIKIEFGNLTIIGSNGSNSNVNFNDDPVLMREISSMIQQELRKAIGGGVLNPNPIK